MRSVLIELKVPGMVLAVLSIVWLAGQFSGDESAAMARDPGVVAFAPGDFPDEAPGHLAANSDALPIDVR